MKNINLPSKFLNEQTKCSYSSSTFRQDKEDPSNIFKMRTNNNNFNNAKESPRIINSSKFSLLYVFVLSFAR